MRGSMLLALPQANMTLRDGVFVLVGAGLALAGASVWVLYCFGRAD